MGPKMQQFKNLLFDTNAVGPKIILGIPRVICNYHFLTVYVSSLSDWTVRSYKVDTTSHSSVVNLTLLKECIQQTPVA